jgi:glycine oxidase
MKISIIGGGIAGCSTAYYLTQDGHDVTLFERDSLASHASGFAQGGLKPVLKGARPDVYRDFSNYSINLHRELVSQLKGEGANGEYLNFLQKSSIQLVKNVGEAEALRDQYKSQFDDYSLNVRWLGVGELSHIDARISSDVIGGLYSGEAYEVDPYKLTLSLWQMAEQRGAVMVNREVTDIAVNGDRVSGVVTSGETFEADAIVVAAGPWSTSMLAELGVEIPVTPLKGQILRLDAPGPPLKTSMWWDEDYATSKSDGLLWIGTTEEEVGFDDLTTDAARDRIIGSAVKMLPYLEDAELVQQTACLRPMTPDRMPIIDSALGPDGLVINTGGGRQGIALGPAMGLASAALAVGKDPAMDISAFSVARFA